MSTVLAAWTDASRATTPPPTQRVPASARLCLLAVSASGLSVVTVRAADATSMAVDVFSSVGAEWPRTASTRVVVDAPSLPTARTQASATSDASRDDDVAELRRQLLQSPSGAVRSGAASSERDRGTGPAPARVLLSPCGSAVVSLHETWGDAASTPSASLCCVDQIIVPAWASAACADNDGDDEDEDALLGATPPAAWIVSAAHDDVAVFATAPRPERCFLCVAGPRLVITPIAQTSAPDLAQRTSGLAAAMCRRAVRRTSVERGDAGYVVASVANCRSVSVNAVVGGGGALIAAWGDAANCTLIDFDGDGPPRIRARVLSGVASFAPFASAFASVRPGDGTSVAVCCGWTLSQHNLAEGSDAVAGAAQRRAALEAESPLAPVIVPPSGSVPAAGPRAVVAVDVSGNASGDMSVADDGPSHVGSRQIAQVSTLSWNSVVAPTVGLSSAGDVPPALLIVGRATRQRPRAPLGQDAPSPTIVRGELAIAIARHGATPAAVIRLVNVPDITRGPVGRSIPMSAACFVTASSTQLRIIAYIAGQTEGTLDVARVAVPREDADGEPAVEVSSVRSSGQGVITGVAERAPGTAFALLSRLDEGRRNTAGFCVQWHSSLSRISIVESRGDSDRDIGDGRVDASRLGALVGPLINSAVQALAQQLGQRFDRLERRIDELTAAVEQIAKR